MAPQSTIQQPKTSNTLHEGSMDVTQNKSVTDKTVNSLSETDSDYKGIAEL